MDHPPAFSMPGLQVLWLPFWITLLVNDLSADIGRQFLTTFQLASDVCPSENSRILRRRLAQSLVEARLLFPTASESYLIQRCFSAGE